MPSAGRGSRRFTHKAGPSVAAVPTVMNKSRAGTLAGRHPRGSLNTGWKDLPFWPVCTGWKG